MRNKWHIIINDLKNNPRDLHTVPKTNVKPKWFYTYTDGDKIHVTNAKEHTPSSTISTTRKLDFTGFKKIYPIHLRREKGESVSQEATAATVNQVYWYSIITFCLKENAIDSSNSDNFKSNIRKLVAKPVSKSKETASKDFISNTNDTITLNGYKFKYLQSLSLDRNKDGSIKLFYPQSNYDNVRKLPLSKYGGGSFCRFSIDADEVPGVYIWVIDNEIIYIGETVNLKSRFNSGYGVIHPRNCYIGGQSTNCKMNKVVLENVLNDKEVKIYFYQTLDYKAVEFYLIKKLKPKYNVKDNF